MKFFTKQLNYFFSINFIFGVHNLLPKLYKPVTCEISFQIRNTIFQAFAIKQKSN